MIWAVLGLYVVALVGAAVVTALKGKWWTLALGLVAGPAWIFGAVRLARPGSWWARHFYDDAKRARAEAVEPRRRRLALVAGVAALVVAAALGSLFKAYRIPSGAMQPTLRCSDGPGAEPYFAARLAPGWLEPSRTAPHERILRSRRQPRAIMRLQRLGRSAARPVDRARALALLAAQPVRSAQ